jgi:isopentenyl phosphate kinase
VPEGHTLDNVQRTLALAFGILPVPHGDVAFDEDEGSGKKVC